MALVFAMPFVCLLPPLPVLAWAKLRGWSQVLGARFVDAYRTAVLISFWLLHPAILGECVLTLETLTVGDREFVAADLSVETSDPKYGTTRTLAIVLLCTFVPAVPLYVFGSLSYYRSQLNTQEAQRRSEKWLQQRFHYFYGKSRVTCMEGTVTSVKCTPQCSIRSCAHHGFGCAHCCAGSYKPAYHAWEAVTFFHKSIMAAIAAKASVVLEPGIPLFFATWVVLS